MTFFARVTIMYDAEYAETPVKYSLKYFSLHKDLYPCLTILALIEILGNSITELLV